MRRHKWFGAITGLLLATGLLAAGPVKADVVYTFNQVGPTTRPSDFANQPAVEVPVVFSAELVVTDRAYAQGFEFFLINDGQPKEVSLNGLRAFNFALLDDRGNVLTDSSGPVFTGNLASLLFDSGEASPRALAAMDVSAERRGALEGSIYYNNTLTDVRLTLDGSGGYTGLISTDVAFNCFAAPCAFGGTIDVARTPVSVPEPSSLALFAIGGLALGALRRRVRNKSA
jgi:hypothetical protein